MSITPLTGEIKSQDINDNFSYLDDKVGKINGGPLGSLSSEAELKQKYPNGANGFFIINGDMWFWEGGKWVNRGVYQSAGVGDKEIKENNYDDYSISLFKIMNGQLSSTNILESVPIKKCGKNLFNYKKITKGYYFDGNDLDFKKTDAANCVLINISNYSEKSLYQNFGNSVVIYNDELKAIKGSATSKLIELPKNSCYIGITIFKGQENSYQIEEGTYESSYESYHDFLDSSELENDSIDKSKLVQKFIEPQTGKNLFNKHGGIEGMYPDFGSGSINPSPEFTCSNWIKVEGGEIYVKTDPSSQQYAFYEELKESSYITGQPNGNVMAAPQNANYLLIAARTRDIDLIQVEKGSIQSSYEPFGEYVTESMLSPGVVEKINTANFDDSIYITIPKKIFMVKNEEFSIYWRNVINNYYIFDKENYSIRLQRVTSDGYEPIGQDLGYKWYYTPSDQIKFKVEIRIMNTLNDLVIDSKIIDVIVTDKLLIQKKKTIVTIGDSFADIYGITKFLHNFVTEDVKKTLNMIGLNDTGKTDVKDDTWAGYGYQWFHDMDRGYLRADRSLSDAYWDIGWGENEANGWKTGQTFADLSAEQKTHGQTKNQFFNPITKKFDFSYYMSNYHSNKNIDGFVSLCGLNDSIWYPTEKLRENLPIYENRINNMISSIKKYDSNIKIFLSLVTSQQTNDSFINSHGNEWLTSQRAKICQEIWNNFMLEKFGNHENENIYIIASNANFDYRYGILEGSYNPVKFDKSIVEKHAKDVHPTEIGSKYIADTVRNWLNGVLFA